MPLKTISITFIILVSIIFQSNICKADIKSSLPLSFADSIYIDLVGKADSAIAQSNWIEAENALQKAMKGQPANPANVLLLSNLAMVQFQQGKDSLALNTINDAHIIAPKSITVLNNKARILKSMGLIDEAYHTYEQILSIDSTLIEPRYMHGIIALANKYLTTAFSDFSTLEKTAPTEELTLDGMALYYFHTQNFTKAIPYFNKLIEINPSIDNYTNKILCHLFCEDLPDASSAINDAIKLYPLVGDFYLHRAFLNHLYYRHDDSNTDIKKAIELGVPNEKAKAWQQMMKQYKK